MKLRILIFSLLVMIGGGCQADAFPFNAKLTIKVVDEKGQPIEGAKVGVGFNYNTGGGTNTEGQQGLSDANGIFKVSGQGNGHVTYGADKEGYYNSHYAYDFKKTSALGWEPRNPELTVMLRKIGDPIPMYARDTRKSLIDIPVVDKDVGFDLIKFDWVVPYGSGTHSDFIFHLKRRFVAWNDQDCTLIVTFSNKYDGMQLIEENLQDGSVFKLPRTAPDEGYRGKLEFYIKAGENGFNMNSKRTDNFIFRIRSEEDDGKLVKALYGKILGPLKISTPDSKTAKIVFKYYLNPEGSRNLEFDPERNMFVGLPSRELVGIQ